MRFHWRRQAGHRHRTRDPKPREDGTASNGTSSAAQTVVNVVYVTASPTFKGPIGGYTTIGVSDSRSFQLQHTSQSQQSTQQSSTSQQQHQSSSKQEQQTSSQVTSSISSQIFVASSSQPTSSSASSQSFVAAVSSAAASSSAVSQSTYIPQPSSTRTDAYGGAMNTEPSISSASATPNPDSTTRSKGMTGGAKAGLAFGLLFGLGIIAALVFFFYRRRQRQTRRYREMEDEKSLARRQSRPSTRGAAAPSLKAPSIAPSSTSAAPRLSLRPVTQFLPDIGAKGKNEAPAGVPGLAVVPPSPTRNLTPPAAGGSPWARGGSPWERRSNNSPSTAADPFSDPINPFGESARSQSPVSAPGAPVPAPLNVRSPSPPAITVDNAGSDAALLGAAVGGVALAGAAVAAAKRHDPSKPLDLNHHQERSESPKSDTSDGTGAFSNEMGATGSPAGPNGPGATNVHRVQLDFKPSMDDELELQAGSLVRLLHEYDDGWALCIRLDRSQQGVAPRTCLSARPVKARPAGGPRGPPGAGPRGPPIRNGPPMSGPPNGRMSPAMGAQGRPMSPGMNGRMSPAHKGRMSPAMSGRPLSPEASRSRGGAISPGAYNRAPRPLSPGPFNPNSPQSRPRPQGRSMSPGPYGGGPQLAPPNVKQGRRRSNSAGAVQNMRNPPPGPSPLNFSSGSGLPPPNMGMSTSPPNRRPIPGMAI